MIYFMLGFIFSLVVKFIFNRLEYEDMFDENGLTEKEVAMNSGLYEKDFSL